MRMIVYLPFVVSALLGLAIPRFGRRLAPATATRLLVAAGVACAASSVLALVFLASTYLGQVPLVASFGDWSVGLFEALDPVPRPAAQLALLALAVVGALAVRTAARQALALRRASRTCRRASAASGGLVVVDDPVPHAYAVPGGFRDPGRVVVTTGILRALGAEERRVLLAHERAHLRHRHHLYRTVAAVAAALNPLLASLPRAVEYTTERWADERAAEEVGDRRVAARAIVKAALAGGERQRRSGLAALAFGHGDVLPRVNHLLTAPPRRRPLTAAALIVAVAACLVATNESRADTESLFEEAETSPPVVHVVTGGHHADAAQVPALRGAPLRTGCPAGAGAGVDAAAGRPCVSLMEGVP
ncbi:M56 family metallopeptidase [Microbispora sp. NEAU-D428]|uniref:M56 family metallopeptidase n=1 Tax=Microbispora sitophila TaxID=2771537 RepID=UPI00186696D6|nr:M56 family metallopeptidase [Microbispora sitophila]MBE3010368.1 M56 family metallopeptidase [Microbispora sitophila]